jgi:hypothetical protein
LAARASFDRKSYANDPNSKLLQAHMDDKVRTAYKTMMEAQRQFHETLQDVISGQDSSEALKALADTFARTHKEFMEAAAPYIHSARS